MFMPGDRIGQYRVLALLKQGGMATLYLCERSGVAGFRKHVAIKVVHPELSTDDRFIRMFVDEALLTSRIEHPNVVHVEELGVANDQHFLVMEYVHGASLAQLMRALARNRRRMRPQLAVSIAIAAADGLHAAHEIRGVDGEPLNVVHRDVSPENILIGQTGHAKLIDFGVAKFRDRVAQTTIGGTLKGKVAYMAPEQARNEPVDRRADVYQLGIILWELLTMRRCFKGEMSLAFLERVRNPSISSPSELAPGISPALDSVVMKALSANPEERYQTAKEMRRALASAEAAALALDSSHMAELLAALLGDELEEHRQSLPKDLTVAVESPSFDHEEVLKTLTIDDLGDQSVADYANDSPTPTSNEATDGTRTRRVSVQSMRPVGRDQVSKTGSDEPFALESRPAAPEPNDDHTLTNPESFWRDREATRIRSRRAALVAIPLAVAVALGVAWSLGSTPDWELIKPKPPKLSARNGQLSRTD